MIINKPKLIWVKGESGYKQGVKGSQNYRHMDGKSYYNGHGGARMDVKMELDIIGTDQHGKTVTIDVRHYLVEAIGKRYMRDDLYNILISCLPSQLEIDNETKKLTEASLALIKEAYEKAKNSKESPIE